MRLIDADALLDFIHNGQGKEWFNSTSNRLTASDCVNAQPTIDAAPVRHATWEIENIPDQDDDGKPYMMTFSRCSVCGKRVYFNFERTKYCSDCGAKMDGEGEKDG